MEVAAGRRTVGVLMDGKRERRESEQNREGGGDDGEERVGGPTCWKTKGSGDERTAGGERRGEDERGGYSSSEVFTHVDAVAESGGEEYKEMRRRMRVHTEPRGTIMSLSQLFVCVLHFSSVFTFFTLFQTIVSFIAKL